MQEWSSCVPKKTFPSKQTNDLNFATKLHGVQPGIFSPLAQTIQVGLCLGEEGERAKGPGNSMIWKVYPPEV